MKKKYYSEDLDEAEKRYIDLASEIELYDCSLDILEKLKNSRYEIIPLIPHPSDLYEEYNSVRVKIAFVNYTKKRIPVENIMNFVSSGTRSAIDQGVEVLVDINFDYFPNNEIVVSGIPVKRSRNPIKNFLFKYFCL